MRARFFMDYDTHFNSAMYAISQERDKRALRRKRTKQIKNKRVLESANSYVGYYIVDERVEIKKELGEREYIRLQETPIYDSMGSLIDVQRQYVREVQPCYKLTHIVHPTSPFLKRTSFSGRKKVAKKSTNRKIRQSNLILDKRPSSYRKMFDFWWTVL